MVPMALREGAASADPQWARLQVDVNCRVRRGAWYRVADLTSAEARPDVQETLRTGMIQSRLLRRLGLLAALAAGYFVAGKVGLEVAYVHPSATVVWPPSGLTLAAFLLLGYEVWPAILLGAFLVNI